MVLHSTLVNNIRGSFFKTEKLTGRLISATNIPSNEYLQTLVVGLGLLLDFNRFPIGLRMRPAKEPDKLALRDADCHLKTQNLVTGTTIHAAGKGFPCWLPAAAKDTQEVSPYMYM